MLAQASPIFHSSCEGKLGIALECLQGQKTSSRLVSRSQGSSPGATGISGLHSRRPRGDRHSSRVEATNPLCSRVATGISWSSLGGLKRVKPPEAFGVRSRDWSLGHAGDEGPHLAMPGESCGCSRAAAPVCAFSRGTTARSVSLSWGAREVGSPCEWRGGARHCSRVLVGEPGLETCEGGLSRSFSG